VAQEQLVQAVALETLQRGEVAMNAGPRGSTP
jgi:hypothetical protein